MATIDLEDIGLFAENLAELQIKAFEVPQNIKIPNWPKADITVRINLGKKEYLYPTKTDETGTLCLIKKRHEVRFVVRENGTFFFGFSGLAAPVFSGTFHYDNIQRIQNPVCARSKDGRNSGVVFCLWIT